MSLRTYVQFRETRTQTFINATNKFHPCEPYEDDCIGTLGVYILDGRMSVENMIEEAKKQVKRLHVIKPWITSFRIIKSRSIGGTGNLIAEVKVHTEQLPNGIKYEFERVK